MKITPILSRFQKIRNWTNQQSKSYGIGQKKILHPCSVVSFSISSLSIDALDPLASKDTNIHFKNGISSLLLSFVTSFGQRQLSVPDPLLSISTCI